MFKLVVDHMMFKVFVEVFKLSSHYFVVPMLTTGTRKSIILDLAWCSMLQN